MSDHYPLPNYAAYIWTAGDKIWVGFPSPSPDARGHSVPFPNTEQGLAAIVKIMQARERDPLSRRISAAGAPCRLQVEKELAKDRRYNELLKAMDDGRKVSEGEKAEAKAFLEELGL
jgi:hypothetical protein